MIEWRRQLKGLGLLLRPVPVLSWSGGACLLGLGLALRATSVVPITRVLRLLAIAFVTQGWLAHSLNDQVDWQSGTDQTAAEILSGGSGALKRGYLHHEQLFPIAALSLLLILALVYRQTDNRLMYLYLAIGLWGAIAYSHPSWRFAYKPLVGEWLAAFPAIVACTLAFYQGFAGSLAFFSIAAALLHGLLSVSWLMQHHLPDWYRDLQSSPPKRTTIAHVAAKFDLQTARLVVVGYFLLTALVASVFSFVNQRFAWTAWLSLLCAALAYRQNTGIRQEMARRELQMVGLTLLHAFVLGWLL